MHDALDNRDECQYGQQDNDDLQIDASWTRPEEQRRNPQEEYALGSLRDADLAVEAQSLGARARTIPRAMR